MEGGEVGVPETLPALVAHQTLGFYSTLYRVDVGFDLFLVVAILHLFFARRSSLDILERLVLVVLEPL